MALFRRAPFALLLTACTTFGSGDPGPDPRDAAVPTPSTVVPPPDASEPGGDAEPPVTHLCDRRQGTYLACADYRATDQPQTIRTATGPVQATVNAANARADILGGSLALRLEDATGRWMLPIPIPLPPSFELDLTIDSVDSAEPITVATLVHDRGNCVVRASSTAVSASCGTKTFSITKFPVDITLTEDFIRVAGESDPLALPAPNKIVYGMDRPLAASGAPSIKVVYRSMILRNR